MWRREGEEGGDREEGGCCSWKPVDLASGAGPSSRAVVPGWEHVGLASVSVLLGAWVRPAHLMLQADYQGQVLHGTQH